MSWENPGTPFVQPENSLKKELNSKIENLLNKGASLEEIVELLDAQEFFGQIETKKGQTPVTHFDVDGFIKKRTEENRKIDLPEEYIKIEETILPPMEIEKNGGNGSEFKKPEIIPRSTLLMECLSELELKYSVVEGKNDPKMMRKLSYLLFILPEIEKMALVNNEEGNASFVFHKAKQEEWKNYINKTKEELLKMPYDLVSSINYPDKNKDGHQSKWKEKIKDLLENEGKGKKIKAAENHNEEVSIAPNGWATINFLANKIGIDNNTLKKYAQAYREAHPEYFKFYKSPKKLRLREHLSPQLSEILFNKYGGVEKAPKDWIAINALSKKENIGRKMISELTEEYKEVQPNWFKTYKNNSGQVLEYFHSDLVEIILEKNQKNKDVPEGWVLAYKLVDKLDLSQGTIKKFAEKFKIIHPEWSSFYRSKGGSLREFYSPELVTAITEEHKESTEGWMDSISLAKLIKSTPGTIRKDANEYRAEHPEWFKVFKKGERSRPEFYAPELIEILKKQREVDLAPKDWVTKSSLVELVKSDSRTIKNRIDYLTKDNPEWCEKFKDGMGRITEYYSPELIEVLKKRVVFK